MKKVLLTLLGLCLGVTLIAQDVIRPQNAPWTPNYAYEQVMAVVGVVDIDGVEQYDWSLGVASFINGECRDAQLPVADEDGHLLYVLPVSGDDGDIITFRLWNEDTGEALNLVSDFTLVFDEDGAGIEEYIHFTFITPFTQTMELTAGFNWVSLCIKVEDPIEMLEILKSALGDNAISIEAEGMSTEYVGGGEWFGDLDYEGIYNGQMFMIQIETPCTIQLEGTAIVDPTPYEIYIHEGFNWIGFPYSEELDINVALSDFQAMDEDMIECGSGVTFYVGEWFGDFDSFVPGTGYMYFSNDPDVKPMVISTGAKARRGTATHFGKTVQKHGNEPISNKTIKGEVKRVNK